MADNWGTENVVIDAAPATEAPEVRMNIQITLKIEKFTILFELELFSNKNMFVTNFYPYFYRLLSSESGPSKA